MKQTAIEFLVELLNNINNDFNSSFKEEIEQAKEMEKQQIIDAYDVQWNPNINDGKDYYEQTFKTK